MRLPRRTDLQGPIALGTLRTSSVLGLRLMVQAGTLLLVARLLGPNKFGAFAGIAALAVMLGALSSAGSHLVLLREVSKAPHFRKRVLPWAIPITLMCGGGLLLAYLLICLLALPHLRVAIPVLLAIGATEIWLQPLFNLAAIEHLARGRVARSQLLTILPLALRLLIAVSVLLAQPNDPLTAYGYGYFAASALALLMAGTSMPAPWPPPRLWRLPSRTEWRDTAGYAALTITTTGPTELDKTLATRLLPLASSGLYAAATRTVAATTLPVIALLLSATPRLFREGLVQPERSTRLVQLIFTAAFAYGVVLAAALWVAAPVFAWFFGTKYAGIELTIRWLCPAVPGMALRIAAGNVLMAFGRPWMRAGFEMVGLAALALTAPVLVSSLGAIGMPLALACSEWSMACIGVACLIHAQKSLANIHASHHTPTSN